MLVDYHTITPTSFHPHYDTQILILKKRRDMQAFARLHHDWRTTLAPWFFEELGLT